MSSQTYIYSVGTTKLVVPPGATLALYVKAASGERSSSVQWVSGGSAVIFGTPVNQNPFANAPGQTWAGASLVALENAGGFVLGSGAAYNFDGPVQYYLMAVGATAIVNKLIGYSEGY